MSTSGRANDRALDIVLVAFTIVAAVAAFVLPPHAQPAAYHVLADTRTILGISNFMDVSSNVAFLLAGVLGLATTLQQRTAFARALERLPYAVFFVALILTSLGSAWYHLQPDNERLFWDRLPMVVAFVSLVAAQLGDRVEGRLGVAALVPLAIVGIASVVYWRATERAGSGNLVPYAIVQLWSLGMVALLLLRRSRYTRGAAMLAVIAAYGVAKVCEHLDARLYEALQGVSGHTLKHLVAALGGFAIVAMLRARSVASNVAEPASAPAPVLATSRPR